MPARRNQIPVGAIGGKVAKDQYTGGHAEVQRLLSPMQIT